MCYKSTLSNPKSQRQWPMHISGLCSVQWVYMYWGTSFNTQSVLWSARQSLSFWIAFWFRWTTWDWGQFASKCLHFVISFYRVRHNKYSRDWGWPRRPWPNAGLEKQKKRPKNHLFFFLKKNLPQKNIFFCIYLLVMPKYWVKNYFAHGRFPEVGQKQKTEEKKKKRKKERKTEQWW